jgi:transcriptional regulator GlxA family with amidase domain
MPRARTIAILLFDDVNSLDVAGPLEAFAAVPRDGGAPAYQIATWSLGRLQVRAESGLVLCADGAPPERPSGDLLVVPGGLGGREPRTLRRLATWIARHHAAFRRVASICTGAYPLAESGIVDGRVLTTHWAHAADLARRYPKVRVNADALFSRDGKFFSSGGVTAGIDLALELIEDDLGGQAAMAAARELVVFLRRTGSQAQFSEPLRLQTLGVGRLSDVCRWASNHLDADLSVEALAARANLSPRQFSRQFKRSLGSAPARYVQTLRLDAARTALVRDDASVEQIARLTGFRTPDGLRRAFERHFRLNPSEYRRRFARTGGRA